VASHHLAQPLTALLILQKAPGYLLRIRKTSKRRAGRFAACPDR